MEDRTVPVVGILPAEPTVLAPALDLGAMRATLAAGSSQGGRQAPGGGGSQTLAVVTEAYPAPIVIGVPGVPPPRPFQTVTMGGFSLVFHHSR